MVIYIGFSKLALSTLLFASMVQYVFPIHYNSKNVNKTTLQWLCHGKKVVKTILVQVTTLFPTILGNTLKGVAGSNKDKVE